MYPTHVSPPFVRRRTAAGYTMWLNTFDTGFGFSGRTPNLHILDTTERTARKRTYDCIPSFIIFFMYAYKLLLLLLYGG